jgi:iron(III) transport system substrate-binding protein
MPTGEATAKLVAEADRPTVSVFMGGTVDAHENLKAKNLLASYVSPEENFIPNEFRDSAGVYKTQHLEVLSIGLNTERWNEEFAGKGIAEPTKLEDLLNPLFKGEIIMPDPTSSGTGYNFVDSVLAYMGETQGWAFLEGLNKQIGQYTSSGYTPAEKTGLGEYLICINYLTDQVLVRNSGYPLKSIAYEGAGWSMIPISVVAGSENDPVTRQFIDFCLTKEAIDAMVKVASTLAVRTDANPPDGGPGLKDIPINRNYDPVEGAVHKADVLAAFNSKTGK